MAVIKRKRDNNNHWDYIQITIDGKKVLEHRYLIEQLLHRKLTKKEVVHHKDGNTRNNKINNLKLMSKKEHNKFHGNKNKKYWHGKCDYCGNIIKRKRHQRPNIKGYTHSFCDRKCFYHWLRKK